MDRRPRRLIHPDKIVTFLLPARHAPATAARQCATPEDRKVELRHPITAMAGVVLMTLLMLLLQLSSAPFAA
jgi:hypothetical protein